MASLLERAVSTHSPTCKPTLSRGLYLRKRSHALPTTKASGFAWPTSFLASLWHLRLNGIRSELPPPPVPSTADCSPTPPSEGQGLLLIPTSAELSSLPSSHHHHVCVTQDAPSPRPRPRPPASLFRPRARRPTHRPPQSPGLCSPGCQGLHRPSTVSPIKF